MFHCLLYGSCKGQSSSKVIPYTCSNSSSKSVLIVVAGLTGPLTMENPGQSQMVWVDLVKPNAAAPNHVGPWSNILESSGKGRTAQAHIWIFFRRPTFGFFFQTEKNETKWNSGSTFEGRTKQPARLVQQAICKVVLWNLPIWSSLLTMSRTRQTMCHGGIQAYKWISQANWTCEFKKC